MPKARPLQTSIVMWQPTSLHLRLCREYIGSIVDLASIFVSIFVVIKILNPVVWYYALINCMPHYPPLGSGWGRVKDYT